MDLYVGEQGLMGRRAKRQEVRGPENGTRDEWEVEKGRRAPIQIHILIFHPCSMPLSDDVASIVPVSMFCGADEMGCPFADGGLPAGCPMNVRTTEDPFFSFWWDTLYGIYLPFFNHFYCRHSPVFPRPALRPPPSTFCPPPSALLPPPSALLFPPPSNRHPLLLLALLFITIPGPEIMIWATIFPPCLMRQPYPQFFG
jgi:hypothetical protein